MKSQYILALDQGTSSSRAVLIDRNGMVAGIAQRATRQIYPQPGWVEHCPRDIWESVHAVMCQVMKEHDVSPSHIAAIGIANQRETTVLWDRGTGEPLMNAIVWQDRRSAGHCDALRRLEKSALVRNRTGLVLDAYFSASKIRWMLDHVPGARQKADAGELAFGTIDAWLSYKLSGVHATDASNASRTMLFNLAQRSWDHEMLSLFDIPPSILPEVVHSSGVFAHTVPELFGKPIPLAGIAGDQQAAAFGQACHLCGTAKNTFGTGSFMLMNVGPRPTFSNNELISTIGWTLEGQAPTYLMEGSVFMAGATLDWLKDGLGIVDDVGDVERLARSVPSPEGVLLVPAFAGLGAPHWDPFARGTILGLSRGSTKAHIARAAIEGIACQNVDVLSAIQQDASLPLSELRVDGGGARNDLLMQVQADLLGVPVVRPKNIEATALGVAQLAGLGVGFWNGLDEVACHWEIDRRFDPGISTDQRESHLATWRRGVSRALEWVPAQVAGQNTTSSE